MEQNINHNYDENIITKFLTGEANPDEIWYIDQKIRKDKMFRDSYYDMKNILDIADADLKCDEIDVEKAIGRFMMKTSDFEQKERLNRRKIIFNVMKVAAVLILGLVMWQYFTLTEQVKITTALNQQKQTLELPDGSVVNVNTASILEYPEKFKSDLREVNLKGEAFFNVVHDSMRPFLIKIDDLKLKVLGTSFNVKTDEDAKNVVVTVKEGKVLLYFNSIDESKSVEMLEGGQMAHISLENHIIIKEKNEDRNNYAWYTGVLVFKDLKMSEAIKIINRNYKSNLVIASPELNDCLITATFNNQPVEAVLEMLKLSFNIRIEEKDKIYLYSDGCLE